MTHTPPQMPEDARFINYGSVGTHGTNHGVSIGTNYGQAGFSSNDPTVAELVVLLRQLQAELAAAANDGTIDSRCYKQARNLVTQAEDYIDEEANTVDKRGLSVALDKCAKLVEGTRALTSKIVAILKAVGVLP